MDNNYAIVSIGQMLAERNKIEREKLEYDKSRCEKNDKYNERAVKTQEEMAALIKTFLESIQNINKAIEVLNSNQNVLYQRLVPIENKLNESNET